MTLATAFGVMEAFDRSKAKILEYPTCDMLILTVATILDDCIFMLGQEVSEENRLYIDSLYNKASKSDDIEVKNQAVSMIISRYIARNEFDKAQQYIDLLPNTNYDKRLKQRILYVQSNELEKGKKELQEKLLASISEVF